jgi:hypothetical protein
MEDPPASKIQNDARAHDPAWHLVLAARLRTEDLSNGALKRFRRRSVSTTGPSETASAGACVIRQAPESQNLQCAGAWFVAESIGATSAATVQSWDVGQTMKPLKSSAHGTDAAIPACTI